MTKIIKNVLIYGVMAALAIAVAVLATLYVKKSDNENKNIISFNAAYTNKQIGSNDISIKYVSKDKCLVVNGAEVYWATYQNKNDTSLITIKQKEEAKVESNATTDEETTSTTTYTLKVNFFDDRAILDDISNDEKLIESSVGLTKENDADVFVSGLWKLKLQYVYNNYSFASEDGHILKIDDNTIYGSDTSTDTSIMKFYKIGNKLYYEYTERDGLSHHYNFFYTEKAGTHCKEINDLGIFGDLIYTVEGSERYYHELVKDSGLVVGEGLKLSASMMTKDVHEETSGTLININLSLVLNKNGTAKFTITGDNNFNIDTTGTWYSLKSGVLIVTKDKGFYNGYFAVDLKNYVEDGSDGMSYINMTDEYQYSISWSKI